MVSIRKELAEFGLFPRKKLGQHFLVDPNILNKVVRTAQVGKEDVVLEVGPGLGQMTLALADRAKKVIAVEIDERLVTILRQKVEDHPNIEVIKSDILKVDFKHLFKKETVPIKVVANLPYQISTPLLFRFVESKETFSALNLMLQKEVAERMVASPGRKEYGPLSIFIQTYADVSIQFTIKPSAFFPAPKVESAMVHMVWRGKPMIETDDEEWFKRVVKACFGYRRKTLINALKHSELSLRESVGSRMEEIGIDPRRRPETLTIQEFAKLAESLK